MYRIFFMHPSADGHLDCPHALAILLTYCWLCRPSLLAWTVWSGAWGSFPAEVQGAAAVASAAELTGSGARGLRSRARGP